MFVPKEFSVSNSAEIDAFISTHPFISLVTQENDFPMATHIPVIAKKENDHWILEGHLALENKQCTSILSSSKALGIILGANAYVSSSVYSHDNVPTWNYQSVHVYGELIPMSENELDTHLVELVDFFEQKREKPLDFDSFPPKMINSYKTLILGFRFKVSKIEAAFKLSQNKNATDQKAIIADLEKCPFSGAKDVAEVMKKNL